MSVSCVLSHTLSQQSPTFLAPGLVGKHFSMDQERGRDGRRSSGSTVSETSACSLALTSCYVARFLTALGPVLVHTLGD